MYANSDFKQRFGRDLLDHRYPAEFTLNANKRYDDDESETHYMIQRVDDEEYLVFTFSLVKVALAMDEVTFFDQVKVNFELRADNLNSFSRVNSIGFSAAASIFMMAAFLGIMWLLFPVLRESVFGFNTKLEPRKLEQYK